MELDPVLILVVAGSVGALLIERIFYYRSKYKTKKENPGHGERIATVEEGLRNLKTDNKEDHELIRKDIRKLGERIDRMKK